MIKMDNKILKWFRYPGLAQHEISDLLGVVTKNVTPDVKAIVTELCYYVEISEDLTESQVQTLVWLLRESSDPKSLKRESFLGTGKQNQLLIEIGPRFNFSTPQSTNIVSICQSLNISQVKRVEVSKRYLINIASKPKSDLKEIEDKLVELVHDRMTECRYTEENIPKKSFNEKLVKKEDGGRIIDVLRFGRSALEAVNNEMGLAFDNADLDYYTDLFMNVICRNPTDVECFDLAQSNSEHSRHWFFKGKMIIDGVESKETLIDMIIDTQNHSNQNNVIKFSDNSSAIIGFTHQQVKGRTPEAFGKLVKESTTSHLIFTAETHNFPTGVAPFSGATTGTGGRIRDVQAVGRGGHCIAGTAGYSTGNLLIPGYDLPWEDKNVEYPNNFALPLNILIDASNGASDYGNKFGEPLICGFTRTFGMVDPNGERKEYIKPIMFSGGVGYMDADMTEKRSPEQGMCIVKLGGPVYRIGVGGGAASSIEVQGDNKADLDFNAVQRGDPEMEQKLNRVIRACLEKGRDNPIISIHDQGAGGNGNVLKELVDPIGGVIYADRFELGDPTINTLELWGAEYQENNAILCHPSDELTLKQICTREKCPVNFVGYVQNTGRVVLATDSTMKNTPFDLELKHVLGKMPQKVFELTRVTSMLKELDLPTDLTIAGCLDRVLRLPSVGSKRFLTNKVDRCVTGLIAQQQCVGPLHTPVADMAVTTVSYFGYQGTATSIGEQPIKGLINNAAGARMSVGEALTNLAFVVISDLRDVKCSGNWMWPAKLKGEGAALYDTCKAMCEAMNELGIAIDGGKDSLSMAARVGSDTIKAPGTLVISCYAPCPDVRLKVTPDLKGPHRGQKTTLLHVDVSNGKKRLGGTAFAQCYQQLGHESPDLDNPKSLASAFNVVQKLIGNGKILAGHDISDGGFVTCVLEMAFAGFVGVDIKLNIAKTSGDNVLDYLFTEELGFVLEVENQLVDECMQEFAQVSVACHIVGSTTTVGKDALVKMFVNETKVFTSKLTHLFEKWEETSYHLELLQMSKKLAQEEYNSLRKRKGPKYNLTFNPNVAICDPSRDIRVAVLREEGTNSDRELAAILLKVGFSVWDVTMKDLIADTANLAMFRGIVFPGGFSYADVLGSAKGWAASILFNDNIKQQFKKFFERDDTFSLGICNGCQLMALIGWIGGIDPNTSVPEIVLDHNDSGRFECRWSTVKIENSKSIFFTGMEKSTFGIWTAHGEGKFRFASKTVQNKLEKNHMVAVRYVDDDGFATEAYPMNPNGSPNGVAAVCSENGRHLGIMPHPERCAFKYQCPYIPYELDYIDNSPWQRMFENAYQWCCN